MKKRVLYDTNVVLDVLLQRHPHYHASVLALDVVEKQSAIVEGYIAGHAALTKLLEKIQVAPVTDTAIRQALQSSFSDFEDAVCHAIALEMGLSVIVTRNIGDFALSMITVELPEVFCANINSTH